MSFETGTYDEDKTYEDGKQHSDDDKLRVRFSVQAVKHDKKSEEAGRAIYYDQEFIQIIIPGSRDISTFALDDHYKRRFKKRYDDWKANQEGEQKIEGTILAELPWMTKSQIAELNYCNVRTVEELAAMSDANAQQFMGNFKLRERAKNFLAAAAGEAPAIKLQAALEERDNHIQVLERKVEELNAAFARMQAEQNRRK
jgi:hypothetical protein